MKYFSWLWNNSRGIRWNTAVRIVTGIVQVMLGLLMVWLSKRFIDEDIDKGMHQTKDKLAQTIPMWHLECLPDEAAARLCHDTITNRNKEGVM